MVKKKTYFVVDDDPLIGEVVAALLGGVGHEVVVNTSSVAALPKIIAQPPDCVIIDIMMPEMDGIELCRQLRKQDHLANTKIIVLSAKAYEFDQRRRSSSAPTATSSSRSTRTASSTRSSG